MEDTKNILGNTKLYDAKWKNLGGKTNTKEGFSKNHINAESPPSSYPPSSYPISESSTNNDTLKRIKKIKKNKQSNPKKIPHLENIYESDPSGLESVYSSPENIFTSFFESPQPIKEGLTLPRNLKSNSPGAEKNASDQLKNYANEKISLASSNMTLSQQAYASKMTETRAQIDKLKYNIFNINKMSTDFTEDINSTPPPNSPADENLMKQQAQDAEKEARDALKRIGYVIKLMIDKLIKWTNLGIAKFKLQMYKFVLKYKDAVTAISRALTGYTVNPDGTKKYHVTDTEINVFSHEIVRFLTILMSWVFLYNWYYLMFFLNPTQQFKLKLNDLYQKRSLIYSVFGPPLRAVESLDWFILEFLPRIRYFIPYNGVLFFLMSIIFIVLVQRGQQWTIMTDFFNAVNKSYTTSIISAFVIGCIVFYCLSFVGYFASLFNFALLKTWYTFLLLIIISVIYILFVITLGVPIGMLAVCGYIFFYSFFAILIYNGFAIGPVIKAISEQITNISYVNFDTANLSWTQWAYNLGLKFVKYFTFFMFEIFLIYILVAGLVVYFKGYNIPLAEKATFKNSFSSVGAFKEAFHHLYTWLIIINVLLIVLIGVIMKMRYDSIKNLAPNQPLNTDTGESMFQKIVNAGTIAKNAVVGKLNEATSLKNSLSQNTILGKGMSFKSSAKPGAPAPSAGNLMSTAKSVAPSSALSGLSIVASDPNLRKAALSAAMGKGLDMNAVAKADPGKVNKLMSLGADKNAPQIIANATGSDIAAVKNINGALDQTAAAVNKSTALSKAAENGITTAVIGVK